MTIKKRGVVTLKHLDKYLKKNTATIISGTFNPTPYYKELIAWAARQGGPLVVIVSSDRAVSLRRGFSKAADSHYRRAKFVLEQIGVDHVLISNKPAHHPHILNTIQPKKLLFQKDNPRFLEMLFQEIRNRYPNVKIITTPIKKPASPMGSPHITPALRKIKNPIAKKLITTAQQSTGPVGKIAAVVTAGDTILASAANDSVGNHAEELVLRKLKGKDLTNANIYITIPPCPMCADAIIQSGISRVYFLCPYGDGLGSVKLKREGVSVQRMNNT